MLMYFVYCSSNNLSVPPARRGVSNLAEWTLAAATDVLVHDCAACLQYLGLFASILLQSLLYQEPWHVPYEISGNCAVNHR